jgi:hypothetical protein
MIDLNATNKKDISKSNPVTGSLGKDLRKSSILEFLAGSMKHTALCLMFKARPSRTEVDPVRNSALINQPCSLINVIYCLHYGQIKLSFSLVSLVVRFGDPKDRI